MKSENSLDIAPQIKRNVHTTPKSILVIDDNVELLELYKTILGMEGYHVFVASSGRSALSLLSEIKEPDLILLDYRMEGMSGPEFLNEFEIQMPKTFQNVPVVFLTALDGVPEGEFKVKGFIRKPMDIAEFLEKVDSYLTEDFNSGFSNVRH